MLGAIAGDIIGSVFERKRTIPTDFPLFNNYSCYTDDTTMTVATAYAILNNVGYATAYKHFGRKYPDAGYGGFFYEWLHSDTTEPYNSWGNGSAMRVSPVGFAFNTVDMVLEEAEKSAAVTHNHPEGIKGAQATALAIFLARNGIDKPSIKQEISQRFDYNLDRTLAEIGPSYKFDVSCQGSVPESIIAFLESNNVEDAIRKAIHLGGDTDTMACIAGGIAESYYKELPTKIIDEVKKRLPQDLLDVLDTFQAKYPYSL